MNLSSIGGALAEFLQQNNVLPRLGYRVRLARHKRLARRRGYFAGILKKSVVYHAAGPYWAAAYGFKKMWEVKYRRNHKSRLPLIDNVRIDEVPTVQYAQGMVIKARQFA